MTARVKLAGGRLRLPQLPLGTVQAVLAALVGVLTLTNLGRYSDDRVGLVLELLLCAAVATVGRWPLPASLVAAALLTSFLALPLEAQRPSRFAMVIVIATLSSRGLAWLRTVITVWWLVIDVLIDNTPPRPLALAVTQTFIWVLLAAAAWALGEGVRRVAVERERGQLDRTAAVQAQRRSIARDLHDTIAYSTTSIILRAEQAKLRGVTDPEVAADLDYIINAGRNTMRDLRGMMETLRRNDPDGTPQAPWQVSSLDEVLASRIADLRNHGFAVTSNVDVDRAALPESAREALTKVLVEATGNMIRHGDPTGPASILIESDPNEVEAVFINRPKRAGSQREMSARLGLVGARERVEALGGEVDVTSESPDWVVRVRIPLGG